MELLTLLFNISIVIFVIATMVSIGFGLRVSEIIEPLKSPILILNVLITNFVIVPLSILVIVSIIPIDEGAKIGLIILSLASGAPFTPKLVEIAKGNIAVATAVMLLQMVSTVFILPFALPLMIGGDIIVDSLGIAKSLIVMMIIPLAISLWISSKFKNIAEVWQGAMVKISNIALLVIIITLTILNGKDILAVFGYDMFAVVIFMITSLIIGYFAGGRVYSNRIVSSLSVAQRNISAGLVVSAQNFSGNPKVTITIIAVAIIGLFIMLFSAKKFANIQY